MEYLKEKPKTLCCNCSHKHGYNRCTIKETDFNGYNVNGKREYLKFDCEDRNNGDCKHYKSKWWKFWVRKWWKFWVK